MANEMSKETLNVKPLLEKAGADLTAGSKSGQSYGPCSVQAMRLAYFRFCAKALGMDGVDKAEARQKAWKAICDETPGWFGTNSSAGMKALGLKGEASAAENDCKA